MNKHLILAATALALTVPAIAHDVSTEHGMKCTTTESGNEKRIICTSDGSGGQSSSRSVVVTPGGKNHEVDVQVLNEGGPGQHRVVIVRREGGPDGADANKDGKITRKEFMAKAEKHFDELDRDNNGSLDKDEARPPMPPLPAIPGMPPMAPLPPVPPVPPVPPQN